MEGMTDREICDFCQSAINTLNQEKKEEVMKCVGQFVYNPKIGELNKKIENFQRQCKHLDVRPDGKCKYCGKQISLTR